MSAKRRVGVAVAILVCVGAVAVYFAVRSRSGPTPMAFSGDSTKLSQTEIVATLDSPITPGKNVIWCASMQVAWKELQDNLLKEPVQLDEAVPVCDRLNVSPSVVKDLPEDGFYTAAGLADQGIIKKIQTDMAAKFPRAELPDFSQTVPDSVVVFGYLKARVPFTVPYFERKPLDFVDAAGNTSSVRAFGTGQPENSDRFKDQPEILFYYYDKDSRYLPPDPTEFALDLCRDSQPNQIVLACVNQESSLSSMLQTIERKTAQYGAEMPEEEKTFMLSDTIAVPEMSWRIAHHFADLEDRSFKNGSLAGKAVGEVLQQIQFQLDRSGADLESEVLVHAACGPPKLLVFNKPFLLYMKRRDAAQPFFVMWVDNAELLNKAG